MIAHVPAFVSLDFVIITLAMLGYFYIAFGRSNRLLLCLVGWLAMQALLSYNGLYVSNAAAMPPKVLLYGILPAFLAVLIPFFVPAIRTSFHQLELSRFTYIHTVRIPVEIVLWWLYLYGAVPKLMTFEGYNVDIIMGITAPLVAYFGFNRAKPIKWLLIVWNVIGLLLLLHIVVLAFLSAPSPLQRLAFEQPNIALLHFPFIWLPTFIVPLVLFSHVLAFLQLVDKKKGYNAG